MDLNTRSFTIYEIAEICRADIDISADGEMSSIERFVVDSRFRGLNRNTCFVALKTDNNDGHKYIADAYDKDVRTFLVNSDANLPFLQDAIFLKVDDSLNSLQDLAAFRRNEIHYPVLAITGSNGKTIVKEWLYQILSKERIVYRSPKSYNSQIGVALSLLMLPDNADIAIIEAGISQRGEMDRLKQMIQPDCGIFTNIHSAHLENFNGQDELIDEKLKLFSSCKQLIYSSDYANITSGIDRGTFDEGLTILDWSADQTASINVNVESIELGKKISIEHNGQELQSDLPFDDKASVENYIHCAIACLHMNMNHDTIFSAASMLSPVAMRLQLLRGLNNSILINDSYNSDLTSLELALNFLNMHKEYESNTLIISDLLQSGIDEKELYERVNKLCTENNIEHLYGIGDKISAMESIFSIDVKLYKTTDDFLDDLPNLHLGEQNILIKGARKFGFERISNYLENVKHETHLDVNLSAAIDNLNYFKTQLKKDVKVMAMVKAFSYGTGSDEIGHVLVHHGIDYLTVAYIEEGKELRKKGIKVPIMVMNPAIGELREMAEYDLEAEVFSIPNLLLIDEFVKESGKSIKVHLKVESGMHRLGFEEGDIEKLISILKDNPKIALTTVFTHLVASDNGDHDDFTHNQIKDFEAFCTSLDKNGFKYLKHVLNSDGIHRFPQYQYDMVRLGIGLYGLTSIEEKKDKLRSVVSLKSRISQIKNISPGESVGYSRAFIADKKMKIATIPIGYADGLVRSLGNANWYFRIGNQIAPIVGNVCMDMTMIDVSEIENVRERDEVFIFSGNADIYKMAEKRGTIPYEILTSMSERIKRVYYYGD